MTRIYLIYLSCYVVFSLSSSCCRGDLVCYMGSILAGLATPLENKTCGHVYNNTQIVSRHNRTETIHVQYSLHGREAGESNISHCLVFRYLDGRADFSCDHDNRCASFNQSSGYHHNVDYKGNTGSLYCCVQDLCNTKGVLLNLTTTFTQNPSTKQTKTTTTNTPGFKSTSSSHAVSTPSKSSQTSPKGVIVSTTPPPSLACYSGTNKTVETHQCQVSHCVTEVTVTAGGVIKVTQYSCDHSHRCHIHSLSANDCYDGVTHQGLSTRTCCCMQSLCNSATNAPSLPSSAPGKPHTETPEDNSAVKHPALPTPIPGRSIHPGKLPGPPPRHPHHSKSTVTLIGGIAGAVFLGLLVLATVGLVVRRCRHPPSETTYSYTQLTADLAEDEATEDEYMLMG